MSNYKEPILAKKVTVFTNGDKFALGKVFYIHPKTTRTFEAFLEWLTETLDPVFGAVRHLRTVDGKDEVKTLDDLTAGGNYVAYGKKFQALGYTEIKPLIPTHTSGVYVSPREIPIPPRRVIASGRAKKIVRRPITINVYRNGDPLSPAKAVLLQPWVHRTWEAVLDEITAKINIRTAIRKLIDLDGFTPITFGADLRDQGHYVACGREKFKNCDYGLNPLTLPVKHQMNRRYPTLPPINSQSQQSNTALSAASAPNMGEKQPPVAKDSGSHRRSLPPHPPQEKAWEEPDTTTEQTSQQRTSVDSAVNSDPLSPAVQATSPETRSDGPASVNALSRTNQKDSDKTSRGEAVTNGATKTTATKPQQPVSTLSKLANDKNVKKVANKAARQAVKELKSEILAEEPEEEPDDWPDKQEVTEETPIHDKTEPETSATAGSPHEESQPGNAEATEGQDSAEGTGQEDDQTGGGEAESAREETGSAPADKNTDEQKSEHEGTENNNPEEQEENGETVGDPEAGEQREAAEDGEKNRDDADAEKEGTASRAEERDDNAEADEKTEEEGEANEEESAEKDEDAANSDAGEEDGNDNGASPDGSEQEGAGADGGESPTADGGESPAADGGDSPAADGGDSPAADGGDSPAADGGESPEPAGEEAPGADGEGVEAENDGPEIGNGDPGEEDDGGVAGLVTGLL